MQTMLCPSVLEACRSEQLIYEIAKPIVQLDTREQKSTFRL